MSEPTAKPSESSRRFRWRRLFQFRLRTLLILTTIIAVALGWWSHKARQQRAAVAAIEKLGGELTYDCRLPWTGGMEEPPKWPQWLVDNIGVHYFGSVEDLILQETTATDAALEHLAGQSSLHKLFLNDSQVTDAGLEHLKGLNALKFLSIHNTLVTDPGVARLRKALPNCTIVH